MWGHVPVPEAGPNPVLGCRFRNHSSGRNHSSVRRPAPPRTRADVVQAWEPAGGRDPAPPSRGQDTCPGRSAGAGHRLEDKGWIPSGGRRKDRKREAKEVRLGQSKKSLGPVAEQRHLRVLVEQRLWGNQGRRKAPGTPPSLSTGRPAPHKTPQQNRWLLHSSLAS